MVYVNYKYGFNKKEIKALIHKRLILKRKSKIYNEKILKFAEDIKKIDARISEIHFNSNKIKPKHLNNS